MSETTTSASVYVFGGPVQLGGGIYIPRRADDELLRLCLAGAFANVLTPRQMGKSSLMERTIERLRQHGMRAVKIDLNEVGVSVSEEEWYLGLLVRVESQLKLKTDAFEWWQEHAHLGMAQRLTLFFKDVVLGEVKERVTVFVDEIDSTLALPFTDDFFAAVRSMYHDRLQTPEFQRLTFILIGVVAPGDLIKDRQRTPYNIGQRIDLTDFTPEEARPLSDKLDMPVEEREQLLAWVIEWTGGHPYLTQRLYRAIAESQRKSWTRADLDQVVASTFLRDMNADINLQTARNMLTDEELLKVRRVDPEAILTIYREVLRGKRPVADEEQSIVKSHLKLSGVVRGEAGVLRLSNRVYREVFNERWVRDHLPVNWTKRLTRVAVALLVGIIFVSALLAPWMFALRQAAVHSRENAEQEKRRADAAAQEAIRQRDLAQTSEQEARRQARLAAEQTKIAEEQKKLAEDNARKAEEQRKFAELAREESEKLRRAAEAAAANERKAKENEKEQRILAFNEASRANTEAARAIAAGKEANRQRAIAEGALEQAKQERDKAIILQRQADELRKEASARRLAVQGELLAKEGQSQLSTSVLLAVESMKQQPSLEADRALRSTLKDLPASALNLSPRPTPLPQKGPVQSVAFSPDGKFLAVAGNGVTELLDPKTFSNVSGFNVKAKDKFVSFSPSGQYLAMINEDGGASIYDIKFYSSRNSFAADRRMDMKPPNGARIEAVIFSRDDLVVTIDDKKVAWIWFIQYTGQPLIGYWGDQFPSSERMGGALDLAFSPDNVYVAIGSDDGAAHILNRASGREVIHLKAGGRVLAVAYSPDGRFLATGGDDHAVRLWEVSTGRLLANEQCDAVVDDIIFTGNGRYMAAASGNRAIVWELKNISSGKPDPAARAGVTTPFSALILPAGFQSAAPQHGQAETSVQLQQVASMKHDGPVLSIAFSPDGQLLATTSQGSSARLWSTTNGASPATVLSEGGNALQAAFSFDGQSLATVSSDGRARVWSLSVRRESLPTLTQSSSPVSALAFDLTGERLIVGEKGFAYMWSGLNKDKPSFDVVAKGVDFGEEGRGGGAYRMAYSQDRKRIIWWWSRDGWAEITELEKSGSVYKRVAILPGGRDVSSLALSPDGRLAAVATSQGTVAVWEVTKSNDSERNPLFTFAHTRAINSVAFSPDGKVIATGGDDGMLKVWDATNGKIIFTDFHTGSFNSVAFSPDSKYVAAAGLDFVHIFDLGTGKEVDFKKPIIHQKVTAVVFSPDGNYLATAGQDGTARVWELARGREVARVNVGSAVAAVAFSGDVERKVNGPYLATGAVFESPAVASDVSPPTVRLWYWKPEDMVRDACSRLATRSLSREEWEQYMETPLPTGADPPQTCKDQ
jgi:WD40 repeat protein